jgi:hypothetical protein
MRVVPDIVVPDIVVAEIVLLPANGPASVPEMVVREMVAGRSLF